MRGGQVAARGGVERRPALAELAHLLLPHGLHLVRRHPPGGIGALSGTSRALAEEQCESLLTYIMLRNINLTKTFLASLLRNNITSFYGSGVLSAPLPLLAQEDP